MKRIKLYFAAATLCAAAAVGYNVYINATMTEEERLVQANLEALSDGETGGSCGFAAYEYDDDWYQNDKYFQRCGDCTWLNGCKPQYRNC